LPRCAHVQTDGGLEKYCQDDGRWVPDEQVQAVLEQAKDLGFKYIDPSAYCCGHVGGSSTSLRDVRKLCSQAKKAEQEQRRFESANICLPPEKIDLLRYGPSSQDPCERKKSDRLLQLIHRKR
jgi:hypothetical protein